MTPSPAMTPSLAASLLLCDLRIHCCSPAHSLAQPNTAASPLVLIYRLLLEDVEAEELSLGLVMLMTTKMSS
uniref:Secreted protein n=1 Tax=Oryza meridionalis TaxID=40149 RepID=A0A0E0F4X9_9ORYZ